MKKQVTSYVLIRYQFPKRVAIKAKREVPYEIKLAARLVLDELVFMWNKNALEEQINLAIDQEDYDAFNELSKKYAKYL
ncbi:IDEAL domain-containing protein [Piscibacillus halophilus]|uniref:IDEAL domain-containing protein n=1 Tax=Piscibacillus halophilus TaxID=571933 RepID=A0A1H9ATL6_9BACI|nr:IDEAL domain-containing protein [Piscibacillus halophilus]SEP79817.1 IDEAL domain-containing protein [Piscibacillus halophilus]